MSKHKRINGDVSAANIVSQVERILAAGEKLRAALQSERWMDKTSRAIETPSASRKWLNTRAATDRAEAAYREAIEECYRMAEDVTRGGGNLRRQPGRQTATLTPVLGPVKRLFVAM